jgi:hypothetical protein
MLILSSPISKYFLVSQFDVVLVGGFLLLCNMTVALSRLLFLLNL